MSFSARSVLRFLAVVALAAGLGASAAFAQGALVLALKPDKNPDALLEEKKALEEFLALDRDAHLPAKRLQQHRPESRRIAAGVQGRDHAVASFDAHPPRRPLGLPARQSHRQAEEPGQQH